MPKEAHTIMTDADGDTLEVWANHGDVIVWVPAQGAALGPQEQEAFGQSYVAACNAADRQRAASHA